MRTKQATGRRWTGERARWAGTAAAALTVLAATGGNAAATAEPAEHSNVSPAAFGVPARATFDYIGDFANLPSAPAGTAPIGGKASMVVTTRATTTGIFVTGLDKNNVYVADVHDQFCFIREGGDRFLFDPQGPKAPPNAIWLSPITIGADGNADATTTSHAPAGPRAKSVVIHLLRAAGDKKDKADPPKLACADLARVTS